jgi:hydrogen peroxide-dependent heme synthase
MNSDDRPEISLRPTTGWHVGHYFYRFDRGQLRHFGTSELSDGCREFVAVLDPSGAGAPARLQSLITIGHKADFGVLAMDADPLVVNGLHQRLLSCPLGPALVPVWSFISLTEVSEYVPTSEQFGRELAAQGMDAAGPEYRAKLKQFERRLEIMRRQRLTPDLPVWPAVCFYPMNKRRTADANWFLLDFAERQRLMSQHGETGMKFGGKVTQLVTTAIGVDDWEWGVTLWARNPEFLKDIVYRMRFDEASAKYAEFGPFYTGYLATAAEILAHCRVGGRDSAASRQPANGLTALGDTPTWP